MPDAIQALKATGQSILVGDRISMGGIPLTVVDVRDVAGDRKRIEFCDGNVFVLGRHMAVNVVRIVQTPDTRSRTVRRPGDRRPRAGGTR